MINFYLVEAIRDRTVEYEGRDASGNMKFADVAHLLKNEITSYCEKKQLTPIIKNIDPMYIIRSVKPNAYDIKLCR